MIEHLASIEFIAELADGFRVVGRKRRDYPLSQDRNGWFLNYITAVAITQRIDRRLQVGVTVTFNWRGSRWALSPEYVYPAPHGVDEIADGPCELVRARLPWLRQVDLQPHYSLPTLNSLSTLR